MMTNKKMHNDNADRNPSALQVRALDFEGHPVTAVYFRGRWLWRGAEVGEAIGYEHERLLTRRRSTMRRRAGASWRTSPITHGGSRALLHQDRRQGGGAARPTTTRRASPGRRPSPVRAPRPREAVRSEARAERTPLPWRRRRVVKATADGKAAAPIASAGG